MKKAGLCALMGAALLSSEVAYAEGAVAVGLPPDVAHFGFASGVSVNRPTFDAARATAMQSCQAATGATQDALRLCTVVATGRNQCFAIAIDPMDGTPGMGWSVAETAAAARQQAIALCQATSGPARSRFCAVSNTQCDGDAR